MPVHERTSDERRPAEGAELPEAEVTRNTALLKVEAEPAPSAKPGESVAMAVVHRPGDVGIDLPPGASARDLGPTDYKIVEMPEDGREAAPPTR